MEIAAPVALVLFAAVVLIHTQWMAPRKARRRLAEILVSQGWTTVRPEDEPDWHEVMTLAVEETRGAVRSREYDESVGPMRFHVKRSEERTGKAPEVYRDGGADHPRYAALGIREERRVYRSFLKSYRRTYAGREIWIGEARRIPVDASQMVFSGAAEIVGHTGRELARKRGLDPQTIPELVTPPSDTLGQAVRDSLLSDPLARSLMARVTLGRRSWVLVAPLARVGNRFADVLRLALEVSATLDRQIGWERTRPR
jgi:hypothetical protein